MNSTEPERDRIVVHVNANLHWSRGKMAAHVAHAVLRAAGVHPEVPIVVLGAKPRDIQAMRTVIHDAGKTELEPGTLTAGTDYVFQSAANRQQAISLLTQLVATADDFTVASRVSDALALLGGI